MGFIKRILLFIIVNICVCLAVSFFLDLFQVKPYLNQYGIQYRDLLAFCLIWGMVGALVSLALSKTMVKWLLRIQIISSSSSQYQKLVQIVERVSKKAHLPCVPEIGVYDSREVNAFATGATRRSSLVAFSSALLNEMNEEELEGVVAHEIAHITNGDMITMTLLQGVINAFVMFLSRVLAFIVSGFGRDQKRGSYASFALLSFVFQCIFMILGSLIIFGFSRRREYRADRGGSFFVGKTSMIAALEALQRVTKRKEGVYEQKEAALHPALQTLKISSHDGFLRFFASHPPLEERIKRLKTQTIHSMD